MQINDFKALAEQSKIKWSVHGLERMQERNISRADVKNCLLYGEIIEEYPYDFPLPSALILGYTVKKGTPLHVVVGLDTDGIYLITAYFPDIGHFGPDMTTRRVK